MTPDELADLLDRERQVRPWERVDDVSALTLADRLDYDDEHRLFRGPF